MLLKDLKDLQGLGYYLNPFKWGVGNTTHSVSTDYLPRIIAELEVGRKLAEAVRETTKDIHIHFTAGSQSMIDPHSIMIERHNAVDAALTAYENSIQ